MSVSSIEVTFDVDNSTLIFDLEGTFPSGVEWFVGAEGPYGDIKVINTGSPDATGDTPANINVISIDPLDAGTYILKVTRRDLNPLAKNEFLEFEYEFCYKPTGQFQLKVSDNCETLYVEDVTQYPTSSGDLLERVITVRYPVIDCIQTPGDAVYSGQKVQQSMVQPDGNIYANVTWVVSGKSSGLFEQSADEWTVIYPAEYKLDGVDHLVVCNTNPCSNLNCIDSYWDQVYNAACSSGGFVQLPSNILANLTALMSALTLHRTAVECGDISKANKYHEQIKNITGCTEPDGPVIIKSNAPYGDDWIAITDFENGYNTNPGNPLMMRIINNAVYFKGGFNGSTWDANGLKLIPLSVFEDAGIELSDGMAVSGSALTLNAPFFDTAVIYTNGGEVYVRTIQNHVQIAIMAINGVLLTK